MSTVVNIGIFRNSVSEKNRENCLSMGVGIAEEYLEQSISSMESVLELNQEVAICRPHKRKIIDNHLCYAKDDSNELPKRVESINKALDQVNEELFNFLREGKNCIVPQFQLTSTLTRLVTHPKNAIA